jgi:hypothetical protein
MKAGGDIDGLWALFESSVQYVSAQVCFMCISFPFSTGTVIAHIPYMLPLVAAIAGRGRGPLVLREFGRKRALERLQMGANRKDLFYHLVRLLSSLTSSFL